MTSDGMFQNGIKPGKEIPYRMLISAAVALHQHRMESLTQITPFVVVEYHRGKEVILNHCDIYVVV